MAKAFTTVKRGEAAYPRLLGEIPDAPEKLYLKGAFEPAEICFAIVGTRKPTSYGQKAAQYFSQALVQAGFTVVSGLALGIDTCAHRAALEAGGRTIAVLGCGINSIYPEENRRLGEAIAKQGAVISEFEPDEPAYPGNFPRRNRIISGLSVGVLVVEAAAKSGALITASFAAEQNREVFALPGPIHSPMSRGPHQLIQEGAKLVTSPEDILEELASLKLPLKKSSSSGSLDKMSETLVILLNREGPLAADALSLKTQIPINQIQTCLTMMELRRKIRRLLNGQYQAL